MTRILSTLDEQCRLGERASDDEFLQIVDRTISERRIVKLEQAGTFSITHYAGKVFYTAAGFVAKNTDTMPEEMTSLLLAAEGLGFIKASLQAKADEAAPKKEAAPKAGGAAAEVAAKPLTMKEKIAAMQKGNDDTGAPAPKRGGSGPHKKEGPPTLGGRLRKGIGEVKSGGMGTGLMGRLATTTTHYIRCVKPNDSMAAFGFEQPRVLQQLQYSGVVEMVRIRRSAFPGRATYMAFAKRFGPLCVGAKATEPRDQCVKILEAVGMQPERHYALGKTMIFLRNAVEGVLKSKLVAMGVEITDEEAPARTPAESAASALGVTAPKPVGAAPTPVEEKAAAVHKAAAVEKAPVVARAAPPEKVASKTISAWWHKMRNRSVIFLALDGMFNAAYGDDQDALAMGIAAFPRLLLVRQNQRGQRASLVHAAAAGGARRTIPSLMLAVHAAALEAGSRALADELSREEAGADTADARAAAKLRCAVSYCCNMRDVLGRTPLHYAARAGQQGFVQWAVAMMCTRPKPSSEDLLGMGGAASADEPNGADELRRAVMHVRLPGASMPAKQRMLVSLAPDALRIYKVPAGAIAGSAAEALAAEKAAEDAPELSVPTDLYLHRAAAGPRASKEHLQVVMVESGKGTEDIIDIFAESAAEARYWRAGLAAASRGRGKEQTAQLTQLMSATPSSSAPTTLELWTRHVLLNDPDWRGETMVHALVRGLTPSDVGRRGPFAAWLLEQGGPLLDEAIAPPQLPRMLGSAAAPPPAAGGEGGGGASALELLLMRAASVEAGKEMDGACAALYSLMVRQASCMLPAAALEAALTHARSKIGPALDVRLAPSTHAALHDAALAMHGGASQLVPPPPPAAKQQQLSMLLLSVEKLDGTSLYTRQVQEPAGGARNAQEMRMKVAPDEVRLAISLVHQPAEEAGGAAVAEGGGGSLAALRSMFGGGTNRDLGGGAPKLGTLKALVEERVSAPPLAPTPQGLLWHSAWSALQLPGEEAAIVLIQVISPYLSPSPASSLLCPSPVPPSHTSVQSSSFRWSPQTR